MLLLLRTVCFSWMEWYSERTGEGWVSGRKNGEAKRCCTRVTGVMCQKGGQRRSMNGTEREREQERASKTSACACHLRGQGAESHGTREERERARRQAGRLAGWLVWSGGLWPPSMVGFEWWWKYYVLYFLYGPVLSRTSYRTHRAVAIDRCRRRRRRHRFSSLPPIFLRRHQIVRYVPLRHRTSVWFWFCQVCECVCIFGYLSSISWQCLVPDRAV